MYYYFCIWDVFVVQNDMKMCSEILQDELLVELLVCRLQNLIFCESGEVEVVGLFVGFVNDGFYY